MIDDQSRQGEQEWLGAYMNVVSLGETARAASGRNADAVQQAYHDAMDKLIEMRAPNAAAMRSKVRLLIERWEGFEMPEESLNQLVLDAEAIEANR